MKYFIVVALWLASAMALGQTTSPAADASYPAADVSQSRQQRFAQFKAKRLEKISARIATLQKLQSCMQAASSVADMRACHLAGK